MTWGSKIPVSLKRATSPEMMSQTPMAKGKTKRARVKSRIWELVWTRCPVTPATYSVRFSLTSRATCSRGRRSSV